MSGSDEKPVTRAKRSNNLWMTEEQMENLRLSLKVSDILHQERTPWQDILVVETPEYGRALMLDGAIQLTEASDAASVPAARMTKNVPEILYRNVLSKTTNSYRRSKDRKYHPEEPFIHKTHPFPF